MLRKSNQKRGYVFFFFLISAKSGLEMNPRDDSLKITEDFARRALKLWNDSGVQNVFSVRHLFQLQDNTEYSSISCT